MRSGDNAYQHSLLHLRNAEFDSSIVAPLNGDIEWSASMAHQSIHYTLHPDLNNGIFIRTDCATTQMCRQRLLNADRTICGYALDNSRARYRRWMGGRTASHNFGSYSSPRHCWRIRLQAPPYFVTNSTGCVSDLGDVIQSACTPFAPEQHTVRDPTDNPDAYAKIQMPYTSRLDVTFVAFDPNPEDRVSLYVVEDPGIPDGMSVGKVQCLPRAAGMASTDQEISELLSTGECLQSCASNEFDESSVARCECKVASRQADNAGQFCPADISCSRAQMRLQWQPQVRHAGSEYKVCVAARDDSQLCHGVSPTATANGWYGERQCMMIKVIQVNFLWQGAWIENLFNRTSVHPVYVGCTLSFDVAVLETTEGVSYGLRVNRAESAQELDAEKSMLHVELSAGIDTSGVTVTPLLGSEGATLKMCFQAGDKYGGITFAGMCTQDLNKACSDDAQCSRGKCVLACVLVEVQKCRYCVKEGDPLRTVMKEYFVDTNWLKLWTLNNALHSTLGTECLPGLDCDQDVGSLVAIDNPQLVLGTPSGTGKRILWAGVIYSPPTDMSLQDIACRWRTSHKSLAAANPDLSMATLDVVVPAHHNVCIVACSTTSVDPACLEPKLAE